MPSVKTLFRGPISAIDDRCDAGPQSDSFVELHDAFSVSDLDASVRFYGAALGALGWVLCSRDDSGAGFGPPGEPVLWLYPAEGARPAGTHVAFRAGDRATVDR